MYLFGRHGYLRAFMTKPAPRLIFEGRPVEFAPGETVLAALLKAGQAPAPGGCVCMGGDCPHCVATVDGVAYVRTCQTIAKPGMVVEPHPLKDHPPLLAPGATAQHTAARNIHCDVVVIGQGSSGRKAADEARATGKRVVTLEAADGQEAVGVYPGPLVVARAADGMWHLHPKEAIVVATGAAEIQPVAPGNGLRGIYTPRAVERLAAGGLDFGKLVAVGAPPKNVACEKVNGELVRFEGKERVEAVVVRTAKGEERFACDDVCVNLGLQPRNMLWRMGRELAIDVRVVGDAARESDLPPCPTAGTLCTCAGVEVSDLESVFARGFRELELVKRATLAGTGTCQGGVCVPHIRSFLKAKGERLQDPFTARPVARQLTIGEISAGAWHTATPRTALDGEHRRLGAQMERLGGWWRPWTYGNTLEEYWAVREGVSLCDVSTLGKMLVRGPGAEELLERLYPTKISTLKTGRCRYVLLLDDRGYVMDDGMVTRDGPNRFALTFTSGGSTHAELWVRDWAEAWKLDVRLLNQTQSLGAINVTGPHATKLLQRAGLVELPAYLAQTVADVAHVRCRVFRLSFTGEVSYELHHSAADSVKLWRTLMDLGEDLGIKPHGLEALLKLRLEKGHIVVGQDTDFDSTPRRINHEWAVKLDKKEFVGRDAIVRTNKIAPDRQLVGLEAEGPTPREGAVVWNGKDYAGYVTSCTFSPVLGKTVMLAWVRMVDGALPETVTVNGREAKRVATPFYDPEGLRARA